MLARFAFKPDQFLTHSRVFMCRSLRDVSRLSLNKFPLKFTVYRKITAYCFIHEISFIYKLVCTQCYLGKKINQFGGKRYAIFESAKRVKKRR